MKKPILVPSVGESVVEATIGKILQPSGSSVAIDTEILELETDKVNQALVAPASGKLTLLVKSGDVVKVGQTIGEIEEGVVEKSAPPLPRSSPKVEDLPKPAPISPQKEESLPPARKKKEEVFQEQKAPSVPAACPPSSSKKTTREKMTKLRSVIAKKLVEVKNQTAMLTTFNEIDMSQVIAVREKEQKQFQEKHGVKLGFMSFFIKAVVHALQEFPALNGRIEKDEIVYNHFYDISCAVSTDKGLLVPVLRNVDTLSYAEVEKELKTLAEKARKGTISVEELQGGTFTITNAGLFGSLLSTPILNPPQSAILGMHNIQERAVVVQKEIQIRPMMYVALSYDHRIVDGKEAVLFLVHVKKNLEEPTRLLLEL